jgi:acyl-CoA reductase-like NAD-dependent aldehyde dehydrogenase
MALSQVERELRDRFLEVLREAALPLQPGEDPEVTLEALIDAAQLLAEHFQRELEELRQEQAD